VVVKNDRAVKVENVCYACKGGGCAPGDRQAHVTGGLPAECVTAGRRHNEENTEVYGRDTPESNR
jgi:hypothetical protein